MTEQDAGSTAPTEQWRITGSERDGSTTVFEGLTSEAEAYAYAEYAAVSPRWKWAGPLEISVRTVTPSPWTVVGHKAVSGSPAT